MKTLFVLLVIFTFQSQAEQHSGSGGDGGGGSNPFAALGALLSGQQQQQNKSTEALKELKSVLNEAAKDARTSAEKAQKESSEAFDKAADKFAEDLKQQTESLDKTLQEQQDNNEKALTKMNDDYAREKDERQANSDADMKELTDMIAKKGESERNLAEQYQNVLKEAANPSQTIATSPYQATHNPLDSAYNAKPPVSLGGSAPDLQGGEAIPSH